MKKGVAMTRENGCTEQNSVFRELWLRIYRGIKFPIPVYFPPSKVVVTYHPVKLQKQNTLKTPY